MYIYFQIAIKEVTDKYSDIEQSNTSLVSHNVMDVSILIFVQTKI